MKELKLVSLEDGLKIMKKMNEDESFDYKEAFDKCEKVKLTEGE
ncbi:MAG: hypothetical protein ACOC2W_00600 [bacterium]